MLDLIQVVAASEIVSILSYFLSKITQAALISNIATALIARKLKIRDEHMTLSRKLHKKYICAESKIARASAKAAWSY